MLTNLVCDGGTHASGMSLTVPLIDWQSVKQTGQTTVNTGGISSPEVMSSAGDSGSTAGDGDDATRVYRHQLAACTDDILPGSGRLLRWSVHAHRGRDDLLISAALTARLDRVDWRARVARRTGEGAPSG
jgi:hypothetical protein